MRKMIKIILVLAIIICVIILTIVIYKMVVNYSFIVNYPSKEQEYRLKVNTYANLYEPYIVYYNYGNYFYEKGNYDEAYKNYLLAYEYDMPSDVYCKVSTNIALTLYQKTEKENDTNKKELLEKADSYLQKCMALEMNNKRFPVSFILLFIIIIMGIFLIILQMIMKKRMGLLPSTNIDCIKKLEIVKGELFCDDIDTHEAYSRISAIVRDFVKTRTKINVLNLTKEEIRKLGISKLNTLMEEIYYEEFSCKTNSDTMKSIENIMEVIRKWK